MHEAWTLDLMRRNPHPNVVRLEGYEVSEGNSSGLVLSKYPVTLSERIKSQDKEALGKEPLDKIPCFKGFLDGVAHNHCLRIAHNDVSPSNIMLDEDHCPVIVELGSCKLFGAVLVERGTPK